MEPYKINYRSIIVNAILSAIIDEMKKNNENTK